jgi:hypothetical protein
VTAEKKTTRTTAYSVIGLFFIVAAVALAWGAIHPRSPTIAALYLAIALTSVALILASTCAMCPVGGAPCRHLFPGKLAAFVPKKKHGASPPHIPSVIIGFAALILMPQLWLVKNISFLIIFWALVINAANMIVFFILPECRKTRSNVAVIAPASSEKSIKKPLKKKMIALLAVSVQIILLGYFSLGLCFVKSVGEYSKGFAVVYFRFGLNLPFISSLLFIEAERGSLLTKAEAEAKPVFDRMIVLVPYFPGLYLLGPDEAELKTNSISSSENQLSNPALLNQHITQHPSFRDTVITFLFVGHSNMGGYCASMDNTPEPRVWLYSDKKGFYHGTDQNLLHNSGSPIMPFLKRMALLYPDYHFCGVSYSSIGLSIKNFFANKNDWYIIDRINILKEKSTIGGVILMFGFVEGLELKQVQELDINLKHLIEELRKASGNKTLPFIVGRYEKNCDRVKTGILHNCADILNKKIESLENIDPFLKLTPIRMIPAQYYCDDHHYNAEGYRIWADDAAALIQMNHLDFWYGR